MKERPEIGPRNDPALREMLVLVEMKHPRVKVGESEMTPKSNESEESARKLLQTFLHHVYGCKRLRGFLVFSIRFPLLFDGEGSCNQKNSWVSF